MNRADLRWALDAVLPHAKQGVTLESSPAGSQLYVWATDRYTAGVATVPHEEPGVVMAVLSKSEATDLLRFIRPSLVAEQVESVRLLDVGHELHVGINQDTAVFDLGDGPFMAQALLPLFRELWESEPEYGECVYRPALFSRFAKAARGDTERLQLFPRRSCTHRGRAIVTIGDSFIGAISGLTYGQTEGLGVHPLLEGTAA